MCDITSMSCHTNDVKFSKTRCGRLMFSPKNERRYQILVSLDINNDLSKRHAIEAFAIDLAYL